ncbi:hypothetical protein [Brevibacillus sp. 179-C9.3 HS]|uniref:hypothetical protein n=1 Tax=unclassified Brevibacillus TaxID=2684853 RepID=UPI0039A2173B
MTAKYLKSIYTNANSVSSSIRSNVKDPAIRAGDIIQCKKIGNLASGTQATTLMQPKEKKEEDEGTPDQIINFDTGHMIISDVLLSDLDGPSWDRIIEIMQETLSIQYPKTIKEDEKRNWFKGVVKKNKSAAAAYVKQLLKVKKGASGANELLEVLHPDDRQRIEEELEKLKNFKLGDSKTLMTYTKEDNQLFDDVYIINALGFDPLHDPEQVNALAAAIKAGGNLQLIAEATGESISAFWQHAAVVHNKAILKDEHGLSVLLSSTKSLGALEISKYFDLDNCSVGNKNTVLAADEKTSGLNTRHTVATTGGTDMAETIPTVKLVLKRNDKPVE